MTDHDHAGAKILVCEDDAATRDQLCGHLAVDRFEAVPAPSTAGALRLCRHGSPDLLLLDLALPEAGALDVLREIRGAGGIDARLDRHLPIILLTRRGDADRIRGLGLDADDQVQKPFTYGELRTRITVLLGRTTRRDGRPTRLRELRLDQPRRLLTVGEREVGRPSVATAHPAVAMITPLAGTRRIRICLGYWQPDGSWADAEVGPGDVGLADAIREELAHTVCTVVCQSFTGEMTRPYHYNARSPGKDGSLPLPRVTGDGRPRGLAGQEPPDAGACPGRLPVGGKALFETSRDLVEQVLCTAILLEEVISGLLEDLPEGAFPGKDNGDVILGMIVGSAMPAIVAAGEATSRMATDLVVAMRERILADLRTALDRSREDRGEDGPDAAA